MPPNKVSVRLMAPFSMRCTSCEQFIYKGTKFNARKSNTAENYLGISIVQFSLRCSTCSAEIVFKTDPKTSDYKITKGADRNLDLRNDNEQVIAGLDIVPENLHLSSQFPLKTSASASAVAASSRQTKGVRKTLPKPKPRKHLVKSLVPNE